MKKPKRRKKKKWSSAAAFPVKVANRVKISNRECTPTYRCCGCGTEFIDLPGPVDCPNQFCKSEYIEWTNYSEWRKANPIDW